MVVDAMRSYLQLASGLVDLTRDRAMAVAKALVQQGEGVVDTVVDTAGGTQIGQQVQNLADDLLATSKTNRDLLVGLVRSEVERAIAALGMVSAEDYEAMVRKVERLERQLDAAVAFGSVPEDARAATAKKAAAKSPAKAPAKKVPAKKSAATKVPVKKAPAKRAPATSAPTKKAPAPPPSVPPAAAAPASAVTVVEDDAGYFSPVTPATPPTAEQ